MIGSLPTHRFLLTLLCTLLLGLTACGSDEPEADSATEAERVAEEAARGATEGAESAGAAVEGMAEAMGQLFGGGAAERAEPVDFRRLRDLLPENAAGMERTDLSGERSGAMGFSMSQAEAEYEDGDGRITIQIMDAGGMGGLAAFGAFWMQAEVDRENSSGYERTTRFAGNPAYEKFESSGQPRSELQTVVADRFFVSATGYGIEMDRLKEAVETVDLRALEGMRNEGRES